MSLTIRDATRSDETAWRSLWAAYLAFQNVDLPDAVTAQTWARILNPDERMSLRLAIRGGQPAGFALHHAHDTSWHLAPDCYLEDLFVAADHRGNGIGRALIDDLIAICHSRGWGRLYWITGAGNSRARALYDSYAPSDGDLRYRLVF